MLEVHGSSVSSALHIRLRILCSHLDIVRQLPSSLLTLFLLRLSNSMIIVYAIDSLEDLREVVS